MLQPERGATEPSIADLAVFLLEQANDRARTIELSEALVARFNSRDVDIHFGEMKRTAALLGKAHLRFKAMSDHEAAIERLMAVLAWRRRLRSRLAAFWRWATTLESEHEPTMRRST